ncbi:MAG: RsmD family RNA methyltransferase [Bacteroidaceae bacterium]|nr:RsmD family RNA methyltransferase [Bacteroidaceae bacterium]
MRIVAGTYRGRHFDVPRTFKARPTTDFAKENLFNVLRAYVDFDAEAPAALDLFAGTGSITLELLSRGCAEVTAVELDALHARLIRSFVAELGESRRVAVVKADVLRFLARPAARTYGFVFADPPYALPQLAELPRLVLASGVVAPGGLFVLEHGSGHTFTDHPLCIDHRSWGSVNFTLFRVPEE